LETQKLIKNITVALENIKAKDIQIIDVSKTSTITDTMIICTGTSTRHTCAIANNVKEQLHKVGIKTYGLEGEASGDWVLLDAGNVILHVLIADTREMYQLEKLYLAI
jgi:ribosome-associated protein